MGESFEVKDGFCRACQRFCPIHLGIKDGKAVSLKPVKDNPIYHGFACAKGRASPEFHYMEGRMLHSMKRQADGSHAPIASNLAIGEIAEKIRQTVERYGPSSVALYTGSSGAINLPSWSFGESFMAALKSPMTFGSAQIDQPGKPIALALHGRWLAGQASLDQADAWLAIGINPAISMMGPPNPAHAINRAKKRGTKIYVVDPRRTEMARQADVFLQARPGQDAVILAGLIHVILAETLHDQSFLDANTQGLENLRRSVAGFTPAFVVQHTGVSVAQLLAVARGYATSKSGVVFAGTGPNMSSHGTLMEYLCLTLMTLCGHWRREGDEIAAHGVLVHLPPPIAQAIDPTPGWGLGQAVRSRNLTKTACGLPTSALAEEILLPGDGQIRILICNGGNPMMAWPDQMRTQEAIKKLDLLVCIDPVISETAKYAHYVIAPKVQQETWQTSALFELMWAWFPFTYPTEPFAMASSSLVDPPQGSDVIDDWSFFFMLGRHLGLSLSIQPMSFLFDPAEAKKREKVLDMTLDLSFEEVWETMLVDSPVPFSEVRKYPAGKVFDVPMRGSRVRPKAAGWEGRLNIGNVDMMDDLLRAGGDAQCSSVGDEFSYKLISRRMKDRYNSCWRHHEISVRKWAYNPAFMNPRDLDDLGLIPGDVIEIRSRRGAITGVVEAEEGLLPGVISMAHAWGQNPDEKSDPLKMGANTGFLIDNSVDYDPYSAIPQMSSIPVNVALVPGLR